MKNKYFYLTLKAKVQEIVVGDFAQKFCPKGASSDGRATIMSPPSGRALGDGTDHTDSCIITYRSQLPRCLHQRAVSINKSSRIILDPEFNTLSWSQHSFLEYILNYYSSTTENHCSQIIKIIVSEQ